MFAVGVGEGVVLDELDVIASAPSDDFVFTVDNYAALASIKKLLALKTCQGKGRGLFCVGLFRWK